MSHPYSNLLTVEVVEMHSRPGGDCGPAVGRQRGGPGRLRVARLGRAGDRAVNGGGVHRRRPPGGGLDGLVVVQRGGGDARRRRVPRRGRRPARGREVEVINAEMDGIDIIIIGVRASLL